MGLQTVANQFLNMEPLEHGVANQFVNMVPLEHKGCKQLQSGF